MRLIFRILGTWLLGLAVVLIVIDGTKSLGANAIITTSLADYWSVLHAESLAAVQAFFETRLFADLLGEAMAYILAAPAFAVAGVPGIVLALAGRVRRRPRFVTSDQI